MVALLLTSILAQYGHGGSGGGSSGGFGTMYWVVVGIVAFVLVLLMAFAITKFRARRRASRTTGSSPSPEGA